TEMEPISISLVERKVNDALQTGAEYIVTNDPGCLLQLDSYIKKKNIALKPVHIVDLLAKAIG
ncbi:MAG TPA: (Fe-S)-binding protein, partial [Bacteroidia bacterium]|nr:(Fe-S)-binding protein [Bacteroidia bacterium]